MTTTDKVVRATRLIPAPPQQIFDLLADPAMHSVLDGSGSVKQPLSGAPTRLALGAEFGMSMKIGMAYRVKNVVVAFDEPRHIAWKHFGNAVWDYRLEAVDGGTEVTESWDYGAAGPAGAVLQLMGYPKRNQRSIEATLAQLERYVSSNKA
ncbi:MAG: hypothetical protein JWL70_2686 [Acidimicrobiia bacterium]|nr:hypothetical protein [Acidimicrobiia bacterium]